MNKNLRELISEQAKTHLAHSGVGTSIACLGHAVAQLGGGLNRASQLEDEPKKARDPALFVGEKIEHGVAWLVAGAVLHSKENGLNGDIAAILKEVEEGQRRMAQLGEDVLMEVAEGFFISDFAMAFVGLGELIAELASEPRENRRADPAKRHEDIVRLIASLIDTREDIQAGRRPSPA